MKRCLDSTFLSDLIRGEARLAGLLRSWSTKGDLVATTEVNFFEAALGVELTEAPGLRSRYLAAWQLLLAGIEVLPLTRRATHEAVRRQAALYARGSPAGVPDLLIAAIAKTRGCDAIVTRDVRGFQNIGLLRVEAH